ncbi:MAG: hypothetical protein WBN40_09880, partial [Pseudomonadales bacterium]
MNIKQLTAALCMLAWVHSAVAAFNVSSIPATAFENTTTAVVWSGSNTGNPVDDDYQQVNFGFGFDFGGVTYT